MDKSKSIRNKISLEWYAILLTAITLFGLYLRVRNLGVQGFWDDEKYTALSVKAILEHGYPLLPSGMIYPRAIILQYITAAFVHWLGPTEFSMRLPAAIFGTALIPLGYIMSTRLYGKKTGLLVAALLSVSIWEIEISRYARMYAPFAFFYVLTAYSFYHYYVDERPGPRWVVLFLALVSLTFHVLALSLALLFLMPFLYPKHNRISKTHLILSLSIFAAAFVFIVKIQNYLFNRPKLLYQIDEKVINAPAAESMHYFELVIDRVLNLFGRFRLPSLDTFENLYQLYPMLAVGLIVILVIFITIFLWLRSNELSIWNKAALVLIVATCAFHQLNLALILFWVFVYFFGEGVLAFRRSSVITVAVFYILSLTFWFLYLFLSAGSIYEFNSSSVSNIKQIIKTLFEFPDFKLVFSYVINMPLMSLFAFFGLLYCLDVTATKEKDKKALFLMIVFVFPLLINGFMDSRYTFFRYSVHIDTFFLTLVILGAVHGKDLLGKIFKYKKIKDISVTLKIGSKRVFLIPLFLGLFVLIDLNPVGALINTGKKDNSVRERGFFTQSKNYPDFKSTSQYVRQNLRENDIIIAVLTTREYYSYLERLDYWVGSGKFDLQTYKEGEVVKDIYVGVTQIKTIQEFANVIEGYKGKRKWLMVSGNSLHNRNENLDVNIITYIKNLRDNIVYIGKDSNQTVYLIE